MTAPLTLPVLRWLLKPRLIVFTGLVLLALLAWVYMAFMAIGMAQHSNYATLGPAMGLFDQLGTAFDLPALWETFKLLCTQGHADHNAMTFMPAAVGPWSLGDVLLVVLMWQVMVFAMMLPSAAPTILTFCDLSQRDTQSPLQYTQRVLLFVLGYLILWGNFSLLMALAQWGLRSLTLISSAMVSLSPLLSAFILLLAGLYQFSPLKEACLTQCRNPMLFFLQHWRSHAAGALHMGVHHGVYCVGCCWALMLVMLVVGSMNIIWCALLGILMLLEKLIPHGQWLAYGVGGGCLVASLLMFLGA